MNSRPARNRPCGFPRRALPGVGNRRLSPRIVVRENASGSLLAYAPAWDGLEIDPDKARGRIAPEEESYTCHARVVAQYALLLANTLGLTDEFFLRELERGAHLHDIGKIGIPRSILCKAGPLTALEREIMKDHPLIGWGMVRRLHISPDVGRVILCHHERFDGRGYPFGLAGRCIPFAARIIALADTLDAITSDRSYRPRQGFGHARAEIIWGRRTKFDPDVVEAFKSLSDEYWRRVKQQDLLVLSAPPTSQ